MDPQNPLAGLLDEINMKPEQLIARINERRARRGTPPLDLKSAYPWVRIPAGRPNEENQADALIVLTTRADRTVTAAELGWARPRRRPNVNPLARCEDAPLSDLFREIIQGDQMHRRNFLQMTGAAVTASALALLIEADGSAYAVENGDDADGSAYAVENGDDLTPEVVTNIENAIQELRALDDAQGSKSGMVWAGGLWQSATRMVKDSRGDTPEGRRLHAAYIELAETYGWMLFDADKHPQAQRVYQTGLRLAREADQHAATDYATRNLLASTAYQASWLGQHVEAKTLLGVASRNVKNLPPRLRAVIADRELFAAGRRGDAEAVRRARDTAHEQLQITGGEEPWWSLWLSPHAIDATTGRAWLAAQQADKAEPLLARRLDVLDDAYPRDRMLATLDLAATHLIGGDPDTAAEFALNATELRSGVTSPRADSRLREVAVSLTPYRNRPAVRALMETC
ncbi:XRE family transcriptional regulator [Streptomyces sp. NPDC059850]|uniref:XRE family transcriptional regulator n=1 Tax=Streptomyces sp. NPDC059850 TaxID=3346970 RepID=UPI00364FFA5F